MTIRSCEERTKRELDNAMRFLLREKPLEQIRVKDLAEVCGIRRQSFYYHFSDIYELFTWSIQRERRLVQAQQEKCLAWQQLILQILRRIDSNKAYYQTLLRISGQEGLREILGEVFCQTEIQTLAFYHKRYAGGWSSELEAQLSRIIRQRVDVTWILLTYWINSETAAERELLLSMLDPGNQDAYAALLI